MSRLRQLISEVHRRSLWQVLSIYAVASWVIYQIVQSLTEGLGLPDWFPALAVVLLLIGLPIVLATAFVQEGAPLISRGDPTLLPGADAVVVEAETEVVARRLFTWRNAILGGVLAFTLLGVGTAGYMAMRVMGIGPVGSLVAAGVIEEGEAVILADFENNTSDSTLAVVATEAFRIDLAQSPLVSIMTLEDLAAALGRVEREAGEAVDAELARELAIREGIKAVIVGEIGTLGDTYVLTIELLSAETGETIAAFRETAEGSGEIMAAIDRLSKKLRERLGESLRTIRSNEPLDRVTTPSLEALYKYSQAMRALDVEGNSEKGIGLLEEAIALDDRFAMAYLALGENLFFSEEARAVEALKKAFDNRDRLTDRERYLTTGTYYQLAYYDLEKGIAAFETLLDSYPNDSRGLLGLAGFMGELRDFERGEQLLRRGTAADSMTAVCYPCLVWFLTAQGKFDEAEAVIERFEANVPNNPRIWFLRANLATNRGDYDAAEATWRELRELRKGSLGLRAESAERLAALAAMRGRLTEAERYLRDAMAANAERELPAEYLESVCSLAELLMNVLGETERGLDEIAAGLERYPLDSIAPVDRPYLRLAAVYADADQPERVRETLSEYQAEVEPGPRRYWGAWIDGLLGRAALAEGDTEHAITSLRRFDAGSGTFLVAALPALGSAYDAAGQADSAIATYERYLTTNYNLRYLWDANWLAAIYQRLGELYEKKGDAETATHYYGRLVELWEDADPELQPRVEAARRAITALLPDQ